MTAKLAAIALALLLALTFAGIGCGSGSDESAAPAEFYQGKTINLIASSSPGGLNDLIARTIASYLERDTGANVVVTGKSGAGGLDGINYVYRSEPDGLTLGTVSSGKFVSNKVMDEPAAAYEVDDFSYIMRIGQMPYYFMTSPDGPYQSIADLRAEKDVKIGGSSPSGTVSLGGMTVAQLLDLDATVVTGIDGESQRSLAVKRGEIAGYVISVQTARASIDSGMVRPMLVLATKRDPRMPEVPAITEQGNMTEEEVALAELWEEALVYSNMLVAPPGMPQDRLTYLRGLAEKWMQDEGFREEIDRVSHHHVQTYVIGDAVAESMSNLTDSLDDFRAMFSEMIEMYRA
jgi:tripartite-type tricarboxylate transporter receptor subunit TctC